MLLDHLQSVPSVEMIVRRGRGNYVDAVDTQPSSDRLKAGWITRMQREAIRPNGDEDGSGVRANYGLH